MNRGKFGTARCLWLAADPEGLLEGIGFEAEGTTTGLREVIRRSTSLLLLTGAWRRRERFGGFGIGCAVVLGSSVRFRVGSSVCGHEASVVAGADKHGCGDTMLLG